MNDLSLKGRRIAVVVESKFIAEELAVYKACFELLGATVDFVSRIYYGDYRPGHAFWKTPVFVSDIDPNDQEPWQSPELLKIDDKHDVTAIDPERYAAIIMSANYTSVRLRYTDEPESDARTYVRSAPVVRFFADIMARKHIVKGALCHGLWILTPHPELLKGRRVTCHTVVMADILNAGADIVFENGKPAKVVTDDDLVTGYSKHEAVSFVKAIAERIHVVGKQKRTSNPRTGKKK